MGEIPVVIALHCDEVRNAPHALYRFLRVRANADDIAAACDTLHEFDLPEHLVVDFSHGNCQKQHRRQLEVCEDICQQIRNGSTAIAGIMAESFLREGTQKIVGGQPLTYGQSITDPCLGWEDTERLVEKLASAVDTRF